MQHLFEQVRPPIDDFEALLIRVFSEVPSVDAIWVREVRMKPCSRAHPHAPDDSCPGSGVRKRLCRVVWLQLARRSIADTERIHKLHEELQIRIINQPFALEVRWLVDDLPPATEAPSCVFRRS